MHREWWNRMDEDLHDDARRMLLNLGYRLLGTMTDAEDVVQETFLRWVRLGAVARAEIRNPQGWLVTTASRLCLDVLGSARHRRERYVGPWLPEPLPTDPRWQRADDPVELIAQDETIAMALLLVYETMRPAERVAFILHDVFQYRFREIAEILGRSEHACRQLASAGRRRLRDVALTSRTDTAARELVRAFASAWETGDPDGLIALLDPSAVAMTDGGGTVSAAIEPVTGANAIAAFLLAVFTRQPDLALTVTSVNGTVAIVAHAAGTVHATIAVALEAGRVRRLWVMRNPDKLRRWQVISA